MSRKHYWVWPIATYLFLGGLGGGTLFLVWILNIIFPGSAYAMALPIILGVICLGVGCFLLVFELGQPQLFLRTFISSTAIIKWGAVILSVSLIFGFVGFLLTIFPWHNPAGILLGLRNLCLTIAGLFGLFTMVYTGVLLSSMKAKPFWNTPLLPVLFVTSATSTGSALITLTIGGWPFFVTSFNDFYVIEVIMHLLHSLDQILILVEIGLLLLWTLMMFAASNKTAKESARKWLVGSWAWIFWGAMIIVGLVLPFFLYKIDIYVIQAIVAPLFVLYSGLLLRFMIVFSDDRRALPGEKRFWFRVPENSAAFMSPVWSEGVVKSAGNPEVTAEVLAEAVTRPPVPAAVAAE